jgi:subtilisin
MLGLSPGIELYSYRVTPRTAGPDSLAPTSWSVIHAIEIAVQDQCDILNLSLAVDDQDGTQPIDESVQAAISRARAAGSILVCAAGNRERSDIAFPASDSRVLAVSAFGSILLCKGRAEELYETNDRATDPDLFIPSFCNIGEDMDFTAPGVGIFSTFPGGGYAIMSGTSMAAPAVTGRLAALLSGRPDILAMPRDQSRSDALMAFALQSGLARGFGRDFEGNGTL